MAKVERSVAAGWRTRTRLVRGGTNRSEFGETSEAIFMTSGFRYDDAETAAARFRGEAQGFTYSRLGNPTTAMFEERMALIEGAPMARATASGMAAVAASLLCMVRAGDKVVAGRALFGSCRYILDEVLPRFGVIVELVDSADLDQWERALTPGTVAAFLETPANPTLEITDLRGVAERAHAIGARVLVDNVFATPILQRPMEFGADVVIYSATKHIDGQGRCLGGCILSDQTYYEEHLNQYLRHTGPSLSPFNAWVLLKGLETLDLRMRQHCANAADLTNRLAADTRLHAVRYPAPGHHPQADLAAAQMDGAGGSVITFAVPGGRAGAFAFMDRLALIDISNNLGDAKTLITHPASTTHQRLPAPERERLGIHEGFLRLSVGLEDVEDLWEDIDRALG